MPASVDSAFRSAPLEPSASQAVGQVKHLGLIVRAGGVAAAAVAVAVDRVVAALVLQRGRVVRRQAEAHLVTAGRQVGEQVVARLAFTVRPRYLEAQEPAAAVVQLTRTPFTPPLVCSITC